DGTPGPGERVAERGVPARGVERVRVAPVFLDVIDAPLGEALRVLFLVPVAAGTALAGPPARVGVEAELEPFGVDVVGERLHAARKARGVRHPLPRPVARDLPAVVDDQVPVSRGANAPGG